MNWYVERAESTGASAPMSLYPTPGVETIGTASSLKGRAHFSQNGQEFAVIGDGFFEISQDGTVTSRGTVVFDSNPATINGNGDGGGQIFVTSGGRGYIYDLTTLVFSEVAALAGKATMGGYLDGYFLALDDATSTLYISALLDGLTWNTGTAFAQRSIAPDRWTSMKVNPRYVWLFGEQTSEVWMNTGDTFPFAPHPSGLIPFGIAAPFSAVVVEGSMVWLGATERGEAFALQASGFSPEVISTFPLQKTLAEYAAVADAVADAYSDMGHTFYLLTFPTEGATWAWDLQSQVWTERGTWDSGSSSYDAWRPQWHAMAFGEHRMLDSETGDIYRMGSDLPLDADGIEIRRLRRAPAVVNENDRIFYSSFEVDLEVGLGLTSGQGEDPQAMLRFSDDGGKTWSSERWCSAGKLGDFRQRVRWLRLGSAPRRVFELVVSDPIPWRVTNAYMEASAAQNTARQQPQQQEAR